MAKELKFMRRAFIGSRTSIELRGKAIPGAEDRQRKIPGFDQEIFSRSHVVCVGAGGIISQIAPTLVRKGIGKIMLLDDDVVEASNLNRQRFYPRDIGKNKAVALARNLQQECIVATEIRAYAFRFQEAIVRGIDFGCDIGICGVDNNPARVEASRYFRRKHIPVIFTAVSRDADHGYVFVQDTEGPCIACLFPDIVNDDRFPCPRTPAIADILQAVGSLAVYAIDTLLMDRPRIWNYRRLSLADAVEDGQSTIQQREGCSICSRKSEEHGSRFGFSGHS
jgi:molybdopterin/thiamine biosynthesis adenylyltransferase